MTQEDKELLFKDLSARLPYGVMIQMLSKEFDNKEHEYSTELDLEILQIMINREDIVYLPYLRSMSSMTEEEYDEYELTFDNVVVYSGYNNNNIHSEHRPTYETFDYLNSIHVDYRDLIENGLAIAVTEENNPYK